MWYSSRISNRISQMNFSHFRMNRAKWKNVRVCKQDSFSEVDPRNSKFNCSSLDAPLMRYHLSLPTLCLIIYPWNRRFLPSRTLPIISIMTYYYLASCNCKFTPFILIFFSHPSIWQINLSILLLFAMQFYKAFMSLFFTVSKIYPRILSGSSDSINTPMKLAKKSN